MNLALIWNFSKQDLKDKYAGSSLGVLWAFLGPLANILIFTLIFSNVMAARLNIGDGQFDKFSYSIYLVAGIVPWMAFAAAVGRITTVFRDKAGIISKVGVSLRFMPTYIVLSEAMVFLISMAFFTGFLLLIGYPITWVWVFIPIVFAIQQLFAYAIGFILATLSVFIEDIREFVPIALQFWFWFTPIVYTVAILPSHFAPYFSLNPFLWVVDAYREIVLYHRIPSFEKPLMLLAAGLLLLALGALLNRKLEKEIRDFI